ncbi:MAG TPA: hypothetical protein VNT76_24335 [Candidatus Binatus sp.]|nr:hypothetical protein [Candidatus Binatus sp.]
MAQEITIEILRTMAQQIGLQLPEEELLRLLPGVNRSRKQVSELRELLAQTDEPAGIFVAAKVTVR